MRRLTYWIAGVILLGLFLWAWEESRTTITERLFSPEAVEQLEAEYQASPP